MFLNAAEASTLFSGTIVALWVMGWSLHMEKDMVESTEESAGCLFNQNLLVLSLRKECNARGTVVVGR